jgi:hypothetical protein
METVDCALKRMLLDIALRIGAREHLSFIAFANVIVAVLDDAVEPECLSESTKAETVNALWKEFSCRRRQ